MNFFVRNRVRECKPIPLFEELEQRIVLDASVDSGISGHALDASHAGHGWNLEYSSDPSVHITPVLNTLDLHGYEADLGTVTWISPFGGQETHVVTDTLVPQTINLGGRFLVSPSSSGNDVGVVIAGPSTAGVGWTAFNVAPTPGVTITGNGTLYVTLGGAQADVNTALNTLTGTLPVGYQGTPTALFSSYDTEAAPATNDWDSQTFNTIVVSPELDWLPDPAATYLPNSEPIPGGQGTNTTVLTTYVPLGQYFHVSEGDFTPDSLPEVILTVPAGGGWSKLNATKVDDATVTGSGTQTLKIQGTPAAINATLVTLSGQFNEAYNGGTEIDYDYFDTDPTFPNPSHSGAFTAVFVDGANGIPFITAPLKATVNQDVPFNFTGTSNLISVADLDWEPDAHGLYYCRVWADNGTVVLKDTSSLNKFEHVSDHEWKIEGYMPWVNHALASLEYIGTKAGADTLHVYVNDWANHGGAGVPLNDPPFEGDPYNPLTQFPDPATSTPVHTIREGEATVTINVLMTNIDNTPQIDTEPTGAIIAGGGAQAIPWHLVPTTVLSANDADTLDVAIRAHHGALSLNGALPPTVTTLIDDSGPPGDSLLYLRGPQTLLNYTLNNQLLYDPYHYGATYGNFTGTDILTVTVMDNDVTHLGNRDPVQRTQEQRMILTVS